VYKSEMSLGNAANTEDVPKAIAQYSQLITKLAELTDESKGLAVAPNSISIDSNISEIKADGECKISVRFNQIDLIESIDSKIRQLVKARSKNKRLKLQIEGGVRRPPLNNTPQTERLWKKIKSLAQQMDIRLLKEHRWSSTNICFAGDDKDLIDGLGPIGSTSGNKQEYILRHSLLERASLLAMLLCKP
jgi:D-alanine-D-alanine ligase